MHALGTLGVLLALIPAGSDMRVRSAQNQAAQAARAKAVADQARTLASFYAPAPPRIRYVRGVAPGTPVGVMSPAQTDIASGTIYYTQPLEKFDKAHEVGHVLDGEVLTDGDRQYFQKLMHAPAGAWYGGSAADTGGSAFEWFGDYYAAAAMHADPAHGQAWGYAQIGPKRLKRFQQAIERLGKRHNLQPYQP